MILNAQRMNGGNPVDVRSTLYDANGSRFFNAQDEQLSVMRRELQAMPRFGQSVMLQTQWGSGLDPRVLEQRMDERVTLENRRRQAWEEVEWFIYRYREHFNAIVDNENNNWDFYNGYQWDSTELNRIQAAKLIPHVSNYMARWARTLIGEERGAETVYNFQPNDDALRLIADLYNQVIPKICQANEWPDRSSQSFSNLSIGGRCMSSVRPDPYDPYRKISLQAERPQEFMYDFENAKDGTLDGCNYLSRHYYIDLEELLHRYPEWSDYLIRYDFAQFAQTENLLRFTVAEPKVAPTAHKRMIQTPSTFIRRPFYQGRRIAWVTEFYRRGALKQWCVRDCNYNIDHDFDYNAPDQAAWFYRNLRDGNIARNIRETGQPGLDLITEPIEITREVVDREFWCGDVLLDVETVRTGRFPVVAMHNEFNRGEWRGFFQDDKSNQQIRNRMLIYWDMLLGGVKGKTFYHHSLFPKGSKTTEQEEWARDPNKVLIGNWNTERPSGNLFARIDPPNHGTLPQVIMNFVNEASAFGNGGLNSIGDAEFSGQSDRLRRGLQESAQTGTVPLMKDWLRHERRIGEQLVYTSQFLHPTVLLGYVNADSRDRLLPVLQNESHSVEMDQITMAVTEVMAGPTKRNQQANTLIEVMGQDPESMPDIMPEVMKMKELPDAMLERIATRRTNRLQFQQEQSERQLRIAELESEAKRGINERKVEVEERLASVKENPPVQYSVTSKTGAPGPDAMTEIYKQHGIDADVEGVVRSEVSQDVKDQARDNARQAEFNTIDLGYQKNLSKIYPDRVKPKKTSSSGSGVRSPKDTSARKRKGAEK